MNAAELRYRRALRWYPASWREANEDVVLGTLLDVAEAESRDAPTLRERVDLAAHGIRAGIERGLPRSTRDRASALALGIGTAFAFVYLFFTELDLLAGEAARDAKARLVFGGQDDFGWGPFSSLAAVAMICWFAAFVAGMVGARRIMLVALAASVVVGAATFAGGVAPWAVLRPSVTTLWLLGGLALVAAMGDPGRTRRQVGWTAISTAVSLAAIVALMLPTLSSGYPLIGRYIIVTALNLYAVAAVFGVVAVIALLMRRGDWFLAVLLAALPWLSALLVEMYLEASDGWPLLYALMVAVAVGVPTSAWLRRRIRGADSRIRAGA